MGFRSYPPNVEVMRRAFLATNGSLPGRVVNLTPESNLDVFERRTYEHVIDGTSLARPGMEQHAEEIDALIAEVEKTQPKHIIEIGVRAGGTSALWHDLCSGLVIGIDKTANAFMTESFQRFRSVVGNSHDSCTLDEVARLLDGEMADLLFIDGDHSLRGTTQDYEAYQRFVKPGGVIAFHDINADPSFFETWEEGGSPRFWRELSNPTKREFSIHAAWGGIGVVTA